MNFIVILLLMGYCAMPKRSSSLHSSFSPLRTSTEVWKALVAAGLQERRSKGRLPGYDQELVRELNQRLFPGSSRDFSENLRRRPPTVEAFFDAFLPALKPFSMMTRDVLAMFEQAGARRSDHNLKIEFNFNKSLSPEAMSLQHFREQVETLRRVLRNVTARLWTVDALWMLRRQVGEVAPNRAGTIRNEEVRDWIDSNGRPSWIDFPGFPRTGEDAVDIALDKAENLIASMQAELRRVGPTYEQLRAATAVRGEGAGVDGPPRDGEEEAQNAFRIAATDFWANTFVKDTCRALEQMEESEPDERARLAAALSKALRKGFESAGQEKRSEVALERDLHELLNLPIWQRRHELYAVWVGSRIAAGLRGARLEWHPDGDTLRFPFSGAQLASVEVASRRLEFWTEKKTALGSIGVFGRRHIQPDYRLDEMPVHRANATRFVVECKQYLRWSIKNFGAALADYAAGCPEAVIVLVNYGPVGGDLFRRVPPGERGRTHAIGRFRPDDADALANLDELIGQSFPAEPGVLIELAWQDSYPDLDLHVLVHRESGEPFHVGLRGNSNDHSVEPWGAWPEDATRNPGRETISFKRIIPSARYDIFVHLYSSTSLSFPGSDVRLSVTVNGRKTDLAPRLSAPDARWWHAATLHAKERRLAHVDRVSASGPAALMRRWLLA